MPHDLTKWRTPALSGDLAMGLVEVRKAMVFLHNAIYAQTTGNSIDAANWLTKYREIDTVLADYISKAGGLDKAGSNS